MTERLSIMTLAEVENKLSLIRLTLPTFQPFLQVGHSETMMKYFQHCLKEGYRFKGSDVIPFFRSTFKSKEFQKNFGKAYYLGLLHTFIASVVLLMSLSDGYQCKQYQTIDQLMEDFPTFGAMELEDGEKSWLLKFSNSMSLAVHLYSTIKKSYIKERLINICALLEGSGKTYITGGGDRQSQATKCRVQIYHKISGVDPIPRPPRKNDPKRRREESDTSDSDGDSRDGAPQKKLKKQTTKRNKQQPAGTSVNSTEVFQGSTASSADTVLSMGIPTEDATVTTPRNKTAAKRRRLNGCTSNDSSDFSPNSRCSASPLTPTGIYHGLYCGDHTSTDSESCSGSDYDCSNVSSLSCDSSDGAAEIELSVDDLLFSFTDEDDLMDFADMELSSAATTSVYAHSFQHQQQPQQQQQQQQQQRSLVVPEPACIPLSEANVYSHHSVSSAGANSEPATATAAAALHIVGVPSTVPSMTPLRRQDTTDSWIDRLIEKFGNVDGSSQPVDSAPL